MNRSGQKKQTLTIVCAFFVGLSLGLWLSRNARIKHRVLRCNHIVYFAGKTRQQTLLQEVESNRRLLLVAVFLNTEYHGKSGNIYNDFTAEKNIQYMFFTTATNISLYNREVVVIKGLNASTEKDLLYLRMFSHVCQQNSIKYNWIVFTESSFFVNIDTLKFLRNLNYSKEFLFLPKVTRNSGVVDYGYDGINNISRIDIKGSKRIIDNSTMGTKEYRKSNVFDILHAGTIMSRSLVQKLSSLTEPCVKKKDYRCYQNTVTISSLNDVTIKNSTGIKKNIFDTCRSEYQDLMMKTVTADLSNSLECLERIRVQLLSMRVIALSKHCKALQSKLNILRGFTSTTVYEKMAELRKNAYKDFTQKIRRGTMFTLRKHFLVNSKLSWSLHDRELNGMKRIIETIMDTISQAHHDNIKFHALDYGYAVNQPISGQQYNLNIFTNKERHIARSTQEFGAIQSRMLDISQKTTVTVVVPLAGRLQNFKQFMKNLERNILSQDEPINLVVLYFSETSPATEHHKIFDKYNKTYTGSTFTWLNLPGKFARARALQAAVDFCEDNKLLFFSDVDLVFNTEFLRRCRYNTVAKKQAYFPVMFKLFNPKILERSSTNYFRSFDQEVGHWALYSYGPVCAYRDDVISVGGFNVAIKEWGYEDIQLFENFLSRKNYNVIRAADPGLLHIYHAHTKCDVIKNNIQRMMCTGAMLSSLASEKSLANYLLKKNYTNCKL